VLIFPHLKGYFNAISPFSEVYLEPGSCEPGSGENVNFCCLFPRLLLLTLFYFLGYTSYAQLCSGSLGDPVVNITFGSGSNPGAPLSSATTNYTYVANDCPQDGMYTIINQTLSCFGNTWHSILKDHTGDPNGYFMLVNASFQPSDFYLQKVDGLCGNTTYEFAAWVMNMCLTEDRIKPNLTFRIEKTDGTVLQSFETGDIGITQGADWKQYGFYFTTPVNTSSVVIRITNNAPGGIGNDIALDDITFRPCGAKITASINGGANAVDLCEGVSTPIPLTASVSAGYNNPVFQWQKSSDNGTTWKDINGANVSNYTFTPTGTGMNLYRLTVSESGNIGISGCRVASNVLAVTIHPNPSIQLSIDPIYCEGATATLKADITLNSGLPWDTLWNYPDANQQFLSNSIQWDSAGIVKVTTKKTFTASLNSSGQYSLQLLNKYGCKAFASSVVHVNQRPKALLNYTSPLCEIKPIQFTDQSNGIVPITDWQWQFGDGTTSNIQNPDHGFANAGSYSTSLVVKDQNNCFSDTNSVVLNIHSLPKVDFGLPKICLTDPFAQFNDSTTISDHSENQFIYNWTFGDPASGGANHSTQQNPKHSYTAVGHYAIQLQVTSNNGCINDSTKVFTVNGAVPRALFNIDNTGTICSKDKFSITNTSTVDFGNIVKVEVYWDYLNNPAWKITDNDPQPGKIYSADYSLYVHQPSEKFTIRYVAYSGINCVNESSQVITVYKNPEVSFLSLDPVCFETPAFIINSGQELTGANGTGLYSGTGITQNGIFNPAQAGVGLHKLEYIFTTNDGCKDSIDQIIQVNAQPTVNAGPDKFLIKGTFLTLHGSAKGSSLTYLWSPPIGINGETTLDPIISPPSDITYSLTVTSADGCTNHDEVVIKVLNELYVPTAFTPNGDGLNDVWRLPSLESYPDAEVSIYNRWGQPVFHAKAPFISWDGTFNGKPQATGTYIYYIDLKNNLPVLKGTITLIR
jgi:FOG: PKD repeat